MAYPGRGLVARMLRFWRDKRSIRRKEKSVVVLSTSELSRNDLENLIDITRFSSFNRLIRVTALVLRFVKNVNLKQSGN